MTPVSNPPSSTSTCHSWPLHFLDTASTSTVSACRRPFPSPDPSRETEISLSQRPCLRKLTPRDYRETKHGWKNQWLDARRATPPDRPGRYVPRVGAQAPHPPRRDPTQPTRPRGRAKKHVSRHHGARAWPKRATLRTTVNHPRALACRHAHP
jgi:hypothetical protein